MDAALINQSSSTSSLPEWSEKHDELASIIKSNDQKKFNEAEKLAKEIDPNGSHSYGGVSHCTIKLYSHAYSRERTKLISDIVTFLCSHCYRVSIACFSIAPWLATCGH